MNKKLQNFIANITNKKIMVCGIGKSNRPLIKMLLKYSKDIIACDAIEESRVSNNVLDLKKEGIELRLGRNYMDKLDADIIFRTPGMNFYSDKLDEAREKGIIITSEMEIFFDVCPCPIVAITGSDGKTTTTNIIAEILKNSGKKVHVGGNIGTPLLPNINDIEEDDIAVVELSSFQLMSMRTSPDVAVMTNLSPNHLDMHKDMDEYINSKRNIIFHQNAFSRAVLNFDNDITKNLKDDVRGELLYFSRKEEVRNGAWTDGTSIYISKNGKSKKIMSNDKIKLAGNHNLENYLAAICAVWGYVKIEDILKTAENFNGVEHRIEFVKEVNGVKYYNDSIASSPTRAIMGTLSLFKDKIIMIAGGYDKKIPFDELGIEINKKVKTLILMGDTAKKIEESVKGSKNYIKDNINIINVKDMKEAVEAANKNAVNGDTVVLCPACASFGLYKNFEERGNHFKRLVNEL